MFKIRWKGYGPEGDSWENEDDLNCPEIIKNFLEQEDEEKDDKTKKRAGKGGNKGNKKKQIIEKESESDEPEENKEYEVSIKWDFLIVNYLKHL